MLMQAAGDVAGPTDMLPSSLKQFELLALSSPNPRAMPLYNLAKRLLHPCPEERGNARDALLELQALAVAADS